VIKCFTNSNKVPWAYVTPVIYFYERRIIHSHRLVLSYQRCLYLILATSYEPYVCRLTNSERQACACRKVLGKRCKSSITPNPWLWESKAPSSYNKNARYLNMLIILYWVSLQYTQEISFKITLSYLLYVTYF